MEILLGLIIGIVVLVLIWLLAGWFAKKECELERQRLLDYGENDELVKKRVGNVIEIDGKRYAILGFKISHTADRTYETVYVTPYHTPKE